MAKKLTIAIFISAIGLFLRLWNFGTSPLPLYVDEASIGYNSYSFQKTGVDEYGKFAPLLLRAFNMYNPALYSYFAVVPVQIANLSVLSVRLPSIVFGTILVFITAIVFSLEAGIIVAISPVFVFFSRGAYEANIGLVLLVLGYVLYKNCTTKFHTVSSLCMFCLSAYAYHGERFVGLVAVACVIFMEFRKRSIKSITLLIALSIILLAPIAIVSLTPGGTKRVEELLPPGNGSSQLKNSAYMALSYISPANIFSIGDPDLQRSLSGLGLFPWFFIWPFALGLTQIKRLKKHWLFVIICLASLAPGIITKDHFSTLRVLPFWYFCVLVVSLGLRQLPIHKVLVPVVIGLSLVILYRGQIITVGERSRIWGEAYLQITAKIKQLNDLPIVFDDERQKPFYILYSFYAHYPPQKLQQAHNFNRATYYTNTNFISPVVENITVRPIDWRFDSYRLQYLVGDALSISPDQAQEHKLQYIATIPANPEYVVYRTDPIAKCSADNTSPLCR